MPDIKGYLCDGELKPAANGYVGTGTRKRDGKRVFFKQFDRYVAPSDKALASGAKSALARRQEFIDYREHLAALDARLGRIAAEHPCLVAPMDIVQCENKLVHVTELVDTSTAVPIDQVHRRYGRSTIMAMFEDVLRTMDAVHSQGIVFIDIKDANTFVLDEGCGPHCLLFDYDDAVFEGSVPGASKVIGTPEYFSPELAAYISRADGDDPLGQAGSPLARSINKRHDIFALGLLLHVLLTGSLPNSGKPLWRALARGGDDALHLSKKLRPDDRELLSWMLRRDPGDRPESCGQILERLSPGCTVVPRFGTSHEVKPALPPDAIAIEPARDGIFIGVDALPGDRVQIFCANGSVLTKRVGELALYGLADQVEPVRKQAVARFGRCW